MHTNWRMQLKNKNFWWNCMPNSSSCLETIHRQKRAGEVFAIKSPVPWCFPSRPLKFGSFLHLHCLPWLLSNSFSHVLRLIDLISKLKLEKASVLEHMNSTIQPLLEKGIVDHSIIHKALIEYLSIADKVLLALLCIYYYPSHYFWEGTKYCRPTCVVCIILSILFLGGGWIFFFLFLVYILCSKFSLLTVICHSCDPTVVGSTPCSYDSYQGWIKAWDALCQAWEFKGVVQRGCFCLFVRCLYLFSS